MIQRHSMALDMLIKYDGDMQLDEKKAMTDDITLAIGVRRGL